MKERKSRSRRSELHELVESILAASRESSRMVDVLQKELSETKKKAIREEARANKAEMELKVMKKKVAEFKKRETELTAILLN